MTYETEQKLEQLLLTQLQTQGYSMVTIKNEADLEENFRSQLNKFNKYELHGLDLTQSEFDRILLYLKGKTTVKSAKQLRDSYVLERDDSTKAYIKFFDTDLWDRNIFQVTHQVTEVNKYETRYDVTILVNGLPLIQIELKRRGKEIDEAFKQIKRYKRTAYKGLYKYIQVFVISNGVNTKYYANSNSYNDLNFSFTFYWSDKDNKRISELNDIKQQTDFTRSFLNKQMVHKIITNYIVIKEKSLMVLRPYQIHAVEAILNKIEEGQGNGFIWHTTGSGKTLTSFKVSDIISHMSNISKVFFLIDRKDLDSQTIKEFNDFDKDCVDITENTTELADMIKGKFKSKKNNRNQKLIVTTIQKLSRLLSEKKHLRELEKYKSQRVVLIIDECHRSQFGEMHTTIAKFFTNAQYIGFTGTPILEANKGPLGQTTAKIFDTCLHSYLIKNAISDKNVLGFQVEYIKTIEAQIDTEDDEKTKSIYEDEVLMSDKRVTKIAKYILDTYNQKTNNKEFCAMLAVHKIPMLIKYYDAFKKLNSNLKIGAVYFYSPNNEEETNKEKNEYARESLDRIMKDYTLMFPKNESGLNVSYSTNNTAKYIEDFTKRFKKRELDIIIVVDMFLTGFDCKLLNTLYVDKNLKYHTLLQAYSRTNRIYNANKEHGNIVCFRNLKKATDEAICLFSQSNNTDVVLMKELEFYLNTFKKRLSDLYQLAPTPSSVDNIQSEESKKEFVQVFKDLAKQLASMRTFINFEFSKEALGISEIDFNNYKSKYLDMYDKATAEKTSILADVDFCLELVRTDIINVDYILRLLSEISLESKERTEKDTLNIKKLLENASDESLRLKSDLIKEFLDKIVPTITIEESIAACFDEFIETKKINEVIEFSKKMNINKDKLQDLIDEEDYSHNLSTKSIRDIINGSIIDKMNKAKPIQDFIKKHISKFRF